MPKLNRPWFVFLTLLSFLFPPRAVAQITPAVNSTNTTVTVNGQQFDIGGGSFSRDGQNLFHLFKQFGLNDGQIANFLSNPGVRNILAGVNGGEVSYINGLIQVMGGNSNLYLLNPAGIVFGPNAQLNVPAAFHASTASRVHFDGGVFDLNGFNDYANLTGNPTGFEFLSTGIIVNEGNLAVGPGQHLTLMGHQVINTGTLSAPGGTITIQAVPETGMVRISQEGMILSLEIPADRIPEDGVIQATDLPKLLTGGEDRPRVNSVVHHEDGSFSLVHDPNKVNIPMEGATAVVSGTVDVSNLEGVGGQINVLGNNVALINAQLNASGQNGGGTILIGGDYLGGTAGTGRLDSSLNAQNLYVDNNSVLSADALGQGDGGTVIAWADHSTQFGGTITARGGQLGGDGGFVETSGKTVLQVMDTARVDTTAPLGETGMWLLDPLNITIGGTNANNSGGPNFTPTATGSVISKAVLETALATNHVTISTNVAGSEEGDITLDEASNIVWASGNSLTMTMRRFIRTDGQFNHGTGAITFNLNQVNTEATVPTNSIQAAHNSLGTGTGTRTINLGAGTYQGATLNINRNVTIQGQGNVTLDGQNAGSVVNISGGIVFLDSLAIQNGGNMNEGGGIANNGGTLTVNNSTISDNWVSTRGGGIVNSAGSTLTVSNSTISGNQSQSQGGGIWNNGTTTVINSTISDNLGNGFGGGIWNNGTVTVSNSTISGNTANVRGGGIFNNAGTVEVSNSTINGNTVNNPGGGIFNNAGTVTVSNSTISGNTASGQGGGIFNNGGTFTVSSSTISGNTATSFGGGIFNINTGTATVSNSTISGNTAPTGPEISNSNTLTFTGNNLIGQNGNLGINGTINSGTEGTNYFAPSVPTSQILAPLGNYGGPTQTHMLLPGSPALNAGDNSLVGSTTTDQRGASRIVGGKVDLGAVEVQGFQLAILQGNNQQVTINSSVPQPIQVKLSETFVGSGIPGLTIKFQAPTTGPSVTFTQGNTVVTNTNGIATLSGLVTNGELGVITLEALVNGVTPITFTLINQFAPVVPPPLMSPSQPQVTPPPTPQVTPPPTIFVFVPPPVELKFPQDLPTILQGQEQPQLPLEEDLCTFAGGGDPILEVDGVPVESALTEQCS